jgi:hypothetical protein
MRCNKLSFHSINRSASSKVHARPYSANQNNTQLGRSSAARVAERLFFVIHEASRFATNPIHEGAL